MAWEEQLLWQTRKVTRKRERHRRRIPRGIGESANASRVEDIHAEQQKWIVGLEKQKAEFKRIEKRSSIDSKNSYLCRFGKDSIVQSQNCVRFGKRTILYNHWIV